MLLGKTYLGYHQCTDVKYTTVSSGKGPRLCDQDSALPTAIPGDSHCSALFLALWFTVFRVHAYISVFPALL